MKVLDFNTKFSFYFFKYNNFHEFCFYIINFYFNCSSNIKKKCSSRYIGHGRGSEYCLRYINKIYEIFLYLKNKHFIQDLNTKIMKLQDFNINFPFSF